MKNICERCESEFIPKPNSKGRFCSRDCWRKYESDHPRKLSEEQLMKLREGAIRYNKENGAWNKGLKGYKSGSSHPFWGRKRPEMSGENNPNWKGGVSVKNGLSRKSSEYFVWRRHVFERDGYTCQKCSKTNTYLHADHIKSFSEYPDLRFEVSNGLTLCMACHYLKTYGRDMPEGSLFGVNTKKVRLASF